MRPQEKQINISGLNINYKQIGNGDVLIVLLHGWGVSSDKYLELVRWLHSPEELWSRDASRIIARDTCAKKLHSLEARTMEPANLKFKILIPDLPGFGKSEEPKEDWKLDDYVEFVDKFIEKASRKSGFETVKNIIKNFSLESQKSSTGLMPQWSQQNKKIILIGHSFGGRVAIKYAVKHPEKIDKLILTGAAGIKHKLNMKKKMFFIASNAGKKVFSILREAKLPIGSLASRSRAFLYGLAREKDYYKASPRMKEIMKNVLAEDLTLILDKIKTPTLLVWGKLDNSTPLSDGKIMNEKIENSELVIMTQIILCHIRSQKSLGELRWGL
jgi:pimeloyl-ACP methyl ester carboxylesterase